MRQALAASIGLHLALLGAAWLMLNWPEAAQETGVESISVDIVMIEDFASNNLSTAKTSATETLVATGAEPIEPAVADIVENAEVEPVEPTQPDEPSMPVSAVPPQIDEVAEIESAPSLPVLSAVQAYVPDVEAILPVKSRAEAATAVAAEMPAEVIAPLQAQVDPLAELPQPVEEEELVVAPVLKVRTVAQKEEPTFPEAEPAPKKKKPVTEAERPKKDAPRKRPAQPAGSGGNSEANSVASVASGSKGAGDATGNAAISKYPGLIQQRLRRALRFPKGAGGAQGEVQVQFVISASGGASNISIVRSSGHPIFDEAAVATVQRAAPFPPIPAAAGKSSWTMVVPLAFQR